MTVSQSQTSTSSVTGPIVVDGQVFDYQGAQRDYALTQPRPGAIRFELRDGDQHQWDVDNNHPSERVEIAQRQTISYGTPLEVAYKFMLEPGAPNTAWSFTMGQLHQNIRPGQDPLAPPFGIGLAGEKMGISIRYTDANGQPTEKIVFADGYDIARGHEYDIDIKAVFDPNGNGRLVVTRDGVTIVDYSGPLGYAEDSGVYWAEGLYRHSNATETVAAVYSDLDINTGSGIVFPSPSDFIGAPTTSLSNARYDQTSGSSSLTVSGTAKAGTTVVLSDNGTVLGSTKADASGHYSTQIALPRSGEFNMRAVAVDASGREGVAAKPVTIEIGSAAELSPRLEKMMMDSSLATIILTNSQPLTITSQNYIQQYISSGLIDKIVGTVSFQLIGGGNGSTYDKQVVFYDATGVRTEYQRLQAGKLVFDETYKADGTITTKAWNADGSYGVNVTRNGLWLDQAKYDAGNHMTFHATFFADGSQKAITSFNPATGAKITETLYQANGSRTEATYGITGRNYDSQTIYYDATGAKTEYQRFQASKLIFDETYKADGTITTKAWSTDGSYGVNVTRNGLWVDQAKYDAGNHMTFHATFFADGSQKAITYFNPATGAKTSETLYQANGSRTEATYGITGKNYDSQIIHYDTAGAKIEYQRFQASKLVMDERYSADGTIKTEMWGADGSHDTNTTRNGLWVEQAKYDAANHLTFLKTFFSDGSQKAITYFNPATAAKTSETLYQVDGSRTEATYGITGKNYDSQVLHYNATGVKTEYQRLMGSKLVMDESYSADGTIKTAMWASDGSHDVNVARNGLWVEQSKYDAANHLTFLKTFFPNGSQMAATYFDPATGAKTKETLYHTDGSREEATYGITGKTYDAQIVHFNAAGAKTEYERLASGKVVFDEHYNSDGSIKTQEAFQYDSAGRTTLHTTNYPGGSGDQITYTYSGTSTVPVTSEQKHFSDGGRLQWKDSTNADGTHTQTATAAGAVLSSHEGVADRMIGLDTASDKFIFPKNMGTDVVANFRTHAAATPDQIGLDSHLVNNFDTLVAHFMTAQGADTLITFDDHNSVLLKDVALSSLSSHDFFFF